MNPSLPPERAHVASAVAHKQGTKRALFVVGTGSTPSEAAAAEAEESTNCDAHEATRPPPVQRTHHLTPQQQQQQQQGAVAMGNGGAERGGSGGGVDADRQHRHYQHSQQPQQQQQQQQQPVPDALTKHFTQLEWIGSGSYGTVW